MTLRPDETIQKALISSPVRFTGEVETEDFILSEAWPDSRKSSHYNRYAYTFVFRTPAIEKEVGAILPNYSFVCAILCSYLSVLYGKRFDSHGLYENAGFFHLPNYSNIDPLLSPALPFHSQKPRQCPEIPLSLNESVCMFSLFSDSYVDSKFTRTFVAASKFYQQAL